MRTLGSLVLLITSVFLPLVPAQAADSADTPSVLRQICQELLDAVAPGDRAVWARYLHERVVHVDENGTRRGKAELIDELTPLPAGLVGRAAVEHFSTEVHGSIAVVTYEVQEHLDYFGQTLHSRFRVADTWLNTDQGWRLIVTAEVKLTHPAGVKVTHLGKDGGFLSRRDVDPGASSGDSGSETTRALDSVDRPRDGAVAQHGAAVPT